MGRGDPRAVSRHVTQFEPLMHRQVRAATEEACTPFDLLTARGSAVQLMICAEKALEMASNPDEHRAASPLCRAIHRLGTRVHSPSVVVLPGGRRTPT